VLLADPLEAGERYSGVRLPVPFAGIERIEPPPGFYACRRCGQVRAGEELCIDPDNGELPVCIDRIECLLAILLSEEPGFYRRLQDPDE
jgi:hypothetical protein